MGFKEDILLNIKGYEIEYQGKKLYVVEQLEYEGDTYICVLHIDKIPETVIDFLKKKSSTTYEYIDDDELAKILFNELGEKNFIEQLNKAAEELKNAE